MNMAVVRMTVWCVLVTDFFEFWCRYFARDHALRNSERTG